MLLKYLQQKKDLINIAKLAKRIGVSRQYLHNIITEHRGFSDNKKWAILWELCPVVIDDNIFQKLEGKGGIVRTKLTKKIQKIENGDGVAYKIICHRETYTTPFELCKYIDLA